MKQEQQKNHFMLELRWNFSSACWEGDDIVCFVLMDGLGVKLAIYMQYEFLSTT